jgi:hypothetical protein
MKNSILVLIKVNMKMMNIVGSGKAISDAINKYGKENFKKEILEYFIDEVSVYIRESELVEISPNTYNLTTGGRGSWSHIDSSGDNNIMRKSKEVRKKVSESGKRTRNSTEHKERLAAISRKNVMKAVALQTGKKRLEFAKIIGPLLSAAWKIDKEKRRDELSSWFKLISPIGETFVTNRLGEFCAEHNLPHVTIWTSYTSDRIISKGKAKGWKCIRMTLKGEILKDGIK